MAHTKIRQLDALHQVRRFEAVLADQKVSEAENYIGRAQVELTDARKKVNVALNGVFSFGNGPSIYIFF